MAGRATRCVGVCAALVLVCGAWTGGAATSTAPFFSLFPGPHRGGALLVDESRGAVGEIELGESFNKAVRELGARHRWNAVLQNQAYYCFRVTHATCEAPYLEFGVQPALGKAVTAIELRGRPSDFAGSDAVSLHGVRIGSSSAAVRSAYHVVLTKTTCAPITEYFAYAGPNTLLFASAKGRVIEIALYTGHNLNGC